MAFGALGRLALSIPLMAVLVYGWYGIVAYWGTGRMLLDMLWVVPSSAAGAYWMSSVWAKEPLDR